MGRFNGSCVFYCGGEGCRDAPGASGGVPRGWLGAGQGAALQACRACHDPRASVRPLSSPFDARRRAGLFFYAKRNRKKTVQRRRLTSAAGPVPETSRPQAIWIESAYTLSATAARTLDSASPSTLLGLTEYTTHTLTPSQCSAPLKDWPNAVQSSSYLSTSAALT